MKIFKSPFPLLSHQYMFTVSNPSHELATPQQYTQLISTISQYHLIPGLTTDNKVNPWQVIIKLLPYSKQTIIDVTLPYITSSKIFSKNNGNLLTTLGRYIIYKEQVIGIKLLTTNINKKQKKDYFSLIQQKHKIRNQKVPDQIINYYKQNNIKNISQEIPVGDFYLITDKFNIAILFQTQLQQPSIILQYIKMGCKIVSIVNHTQINYQTFINYYKNKQNHQIYIENNLTRLYNVRKICWDHKVLVLYGGCKTVTNLNKIYFDRSFVEYSNDLDLPQNFRTWETDDVEFFPVVNHMSHKKFTQQAEFNSNRINVSKKYKFQIKKQQEQNLKQIKKFNKLQSINLNFKKFEIKTLSKIFIQKLKQFQSIIYISNNYKKLFNKIQITNKSMIKCMYVFNIINFFILSKPKEIRVPFIMKIPFTKKSKNLFQIIIFIYDKLKIFQTNYPDLNVKFSIQEIIQLYLDSDQKNTENDFKQELSLMKIISGNDNFFILKLQQFISLYDKQKPLYICSDDFNQRNLITKICKQTNRKLNFLDFIMADQFDLPLQIKPSEEDNSNMSDSLQACKYYNVLQHYKITVKQSQTKILEQIYSQRLQQCKKIQKQRAKKNLLACHECKGQMKKELLEKCKSCQEYFCLFCIEKITGLCDYNTSQNFQRFCPFCKNKCCCSKCKIKKIQKQLEQKQLKNQGQKYIGQKQNINNQTNKQNKIHFKSIADKKLIRIKPCEKCKIMNIGDRRNIFLQCLQCGDNNCYFCVNQDYLKAGSNISTQQTFFKNWKCFKCDEKWKNLIKNKENNSLKITQEQPIEQQNKIMIEFKSNKEKIKELEYNNKNIIHQITQKNINIYRNNNSLFEQVPKKPVFFKTNLNDNQQKIFNKQNFLQNYQSKPQINLNNQNIIIPTVFPPPLKKNDDKKSYAKENKLQSDNTQKKKPSDSDKKEQKDYQSVSNPHNIQIVWRQKPSDKHKKKKFFQIYNSSSSSKTSSSSNSSILEYSRINKKYLLSSKDKAYVDTSKPIKWKIKKSESSKISDFLSSSSSSSSKSQKSSQSSISSKSKSHKQKKNKNRNRSRQRKQRMKIQFNRASHQKEQKKSKDNNRKKHHQKPIDIQFRFKRKSQNYARDYLLLQNNYFRERNSYQEKDGLGMYGQSFNQNNQKAYRQFLENYNKNYGAQEFTQSTKNRYQQYYKNYNLHAVPTERSGYRSSPYKNCQFRKSETHNSLNENKPQWGNKTELRGQDGLLFYSNRTAKNKQEYQGDY